MADEQDVVAATHASCLAQFGAEQAEEIGAGDRGMGEDDRFVAFVGQAAQKVLDQQSLAHAVGAVEQATSPHRHQLFEAVPGLVKGVRGIRFFHGRAERQLAGAPESFEGGVKIRRIYRGGHNRGRYRFWH